MANINVNKRHGDKAKLQRRDAALIELSHHCTKRTYWT